MIGYVFLSFSWFGVVWVINSWAEGSYHDYWDDWAGVDNNESGVGGSKECSHETEVGEWVTEGYFG